MASFNLASSTLPKCGQFGAPVVRRSPWSSRVFVPVTRRHIQTTSSGSDSSATATASAAAKQGINEAKQTGQDVKNMATSAVARLEHETGEAAGEISQTTQELATKAKQTAQDAWGSIKDTPQKIKEAVSAKTEDTKEFVKENAEKVQRNLNTKN